MILVTLGTQDKPFKRLLLAIQKEIDNGNIKFLDKDVSQELVLKKVEEFINNGE